MPRNREPRSPGALVKAIVKRIPRGRVATYGCVGKVAAATERPIGGARTVAWILASLGGRDNTPWQRVVGAGGRILLPDHRGARQVRLLTNEGVRFANERIVAEALLTEGELASRLPRGRG